MSGGQTHSAYDPEATYVSTGDLARRIIDDSFQNQYSSRYVNPEASGPVYVGNGLRIMGDSSDYHSWRIDIRDAVELMKRLRAAQVSLGKEVRFPGTDKAPLRPHVDLEGDQVEDVHNYLRSIGAFDHLRQAEQTDQPRTGGRLSGFLRIIGLGK